VCPAPWRLRIIGAYLQVEKVHRTPNPLFLTSADGANECLGEIHRMNDQSSWFRISPDDARSRTPVGICWVHGCNQHARI
jgi:hypothetical protein